jgi:light-regulated signal transduction histidine kinase (bacteriophytochrome)
MSTPKSALRESETQPNPGRLSFARTPDLALERSSAENAQRALLNILEDFAAEKTGLESGQRAILNILEDFDAEKARMEGAQRASLNILDDFASEKTQLQATQGAMVNILNDFSEEKANLEETQRAVLNILDDFEKERNVELINQQLHREIEERKRAEEELANQAQELGRSNAELQQFAYVASHDLQEPLRMVASFTQLLAQRYQGKLGADADEFIGYAVDGARRMQVLVNDLLAYSRVGTRAKEFAAVDCERVLQMVLANLEKTLEESRGQVTHDLLPRLQGDETQLCQVLQNLVGNALKFHGSEPPRVHVSAQRVRGEWRFAVRDNGIGIDPEHAERIFLLFQRLHTRAEYPGTGMGLAITKKIVERHGGRIWVESEPEKGSTFYFNLPMREVTHATQLGTSAAG